MPQPDRILDLHASDRPRERLAERGPEALRSAELLAILLRTGVRGASAVTVADNLLQRFGSLEAVARAPWPQLVGHGIGRSMHEDPPVFNYAVRGLTPKIQPGLVVAIEPMVTNGTEITKVLDDDWTVATVDGSDASHWEHSIAIHEGGIWVLTASDGGAAELAKLGVTVAPLGD